MIIAIVLMAFGVDARDICREAKLTVLYDNYPHAPGLTTGWGFSCLIEGVEETILFDTGGDGQLLLSNAEKLGVDMSRISVVFLSHVHGDHTGGLDAFLNIKSDVTVYLPSSFPASFKEAVSARGAEVVEVSKPVRICRGVYSTGEMGTSIPEQSLVIRTPSGAVLITGCAHQGIVEACERAKQIGGDKLLFAVGGFHLGWVGKEGFDGHRAGAEKHGLGVRRSVPLLGQCCEAALCPGMGRKIPLRRRRLGHKHR